MKKVLILFTTIFLLQFLASCIPCNCGLSSDYDVLYDGVEVANYDASGFQAKVLEESDTVHKSTFFLQVSLQFELEERTGAILPKSSYGFSSAMACSCPGPGMFYPDAVHHVKIFLIDTETDKKTEVTADFVTYYEYGSTEPISLDRFFEQKREGKSDFRFELFEYQNIASSSVFVVEAYLNSGEMFSQSSPQVFFYD